VVHSNSSRTAFAGRIPSEKALGMPNVRESYDIPIKTRKGKNADQTDLERTEDGGRRTEG
jgi:hypothetical protein